MDSVAYWVGFEDACNIIFGLISRNDKVPAQAEEELLVFILQVRQAKADGILADIELYEVRVRIITGQGNGGKP